MKIGKRYFTSESIRTALPFADVADDTTAFVLYIMWDRSNLICRCDGFGLCLRMKLSQSSTAARCFSLWTN